MKSLVVGLGFGQLYKNILLKMGHQVVTVDSNPVTNPDFQNVATALATHSSFDTAHICVPNYLHYELALKVAPHSRIVFVEKPGVETIDQWKALLTLNTSTRFMMTKNNMWRNNLDEMVESCNASQGIQIKWVNKNRIPSPGSWFTNKKQAFGGVSRDLLPHLLSLFIATNKENYKDFKIDNYTLEQRWNLDDCKTTDYGHVKADGVYDVDDSAVLELTNGKKTYTLCANWRGGFHDDIALHFYNNGSSHLKSIPLGLCPEEAYENMIKHSLLHLQDDDFWNKQFEYDLWIQEKINEKSTNTIH